MSLRSRLDRLEDAAAASAPPPEFTGRARLKQTRLPDGTLSPPHEEFRAQIAAARAENKFVTASWAERPPELPPRPAGDAAGRGPAPRRPGGPPPIGCVHLVPVTAADRDD